MDYASKYRETLLYNIYRMGMNSIERGSKDSWTVTPKRIALLRAAAISRARKSPTKPGLPTVLRAQKLPAACHPDLYRPSCTNRNCATRAATSSLGPTGFPHCHEVHRILIKCGIAVHRATTGFHSSRKNYPAGSYIVKTAQAFRPHVLDMFEPQDHPNDFRFPGGPPIPPTTSTGYTLAYLMDVQFDRILDGFPGPSEKLPFEKLSDEIKPPAASSQVHRIPQAT